MPHIDTVSRIIEAGPHLIYRAWLDPQALIRWLPPAGMTGSVALFEPHQGGRYEITLRYDDETIAGKSGEHTDVAHGRFTRLVVDELIEQQIVFDSPDPAFAGTMTMTWTLAPVGKGTEVTVTCSDVPDGIRHDDHVEGIGSTLQNLATYLESA